MSPICEHKVAVSDSCDNNILLQSASNINHSLLSTLATSLELFAYTLLHMLHTLYGFKSGCLAATDQSSEVGGGGSHCNRWMVSWAWSAGDCWKVNMSPAATDFSAGSIRCKSRTLCDTSQFSFTTDLRRSRGDTHVRYCDWYRQELGEPRTSVYSRRFAAMFLFCCFMMASSVVLLWPLC